jgi:hypothetical protein
VPVAGGRGTGGILGEYSAYLLDQMIGVVTASTLSMHVLHVSPETQAVRHPWLELTIPFFNGIFRYCLHRRDGASRPAPDGPSAADMRGAVGARGRLIIYS